MKSTVMSDYEKKRRIERLVTIAVVILLVISTLAILTYIFKQ